MKSAVHFGAGNIGRGFIGLLLHQAGYRVTFVDVNRTMVDALNRNRRYTVRFAAADAVPAEVNGVSAVHSEDEAAVTRALASADIITTAVGPAILRYVAPAIAAGLAARPAAAPSAVVIACENLVGASAQLERLVRESAGPGALPAIFANCAVDRIVPAQVPDAGDVSAVTVEPFCEWVIDAADFGTVAPPRLPGANFVHDLRPYLERKLFTVNTGHAALAYLGYRAGCRFVHEAMALPAVRAVVTGALQESGAGLVARHQLDPVVHSAYIAQVLERFANPLLPDEVVRVGRSPLRKLGRDDRLVGPACLALEAGVKPDHLARVIAATLAFSHPADAEAVALQEELRTSGPATVLARHSGLPAGHPLQRLVLAHYSDLAAAVTPSTPVQLSGLPSSPGIGLGRAVLVQREPQLDLTAPGGTPKEEDARLTAALFQAALDLRVLRNDTRERLGAAKAEIFDVHLSFLSDPELVGQTRRLIADPGLSASAALAQASAAFVAILEQSGDDMLISRASDLNDVTQRIQALLAGGTSPKAIRFDSDVILIGHDFTPSDTAQLDLRHVRGFVTVGGSLNSHSAILARALRLPAVACVANAFEVIPDGASMILDGATGTVTLHPSPEQFAAAQERRDRQLAEEETLARFARLPSRTADGHALALAANIGRVEEIPAALAQGAEGIGLYRSEFSYLDRTALPTEDELYHLYRQVLEQMAPHPVIIRTLDAGGDKQIPGLSLPREENPFLGVRGLRLCLAHEQLFRTQLRALLRASPHGHLKIMLPMVAVAAEAHLARQWFLEERARVQAAGHAVAPIIELGIMIEIPAAALMAGQLAQAVDFFSIGTNDLVQYTMAADRMNGRLAHLQAAHHPAILQLIKLTVDAAHQHGKWVGLCGEMGSDPMALPLLDGLGLDEISLNAEAIVRTRAALSRLDHAANVQLATRCLGLGSAEEVAAAVSSLQPH